MLIPSFYEYLISQTDNPPLAEMGGTVQIQRLEKGVYVYQPGDSPTCIHLIHKGIVKIGSYSPDGERVVYDVLQPGEFFGDLKYLGNGVEFFEFAKTVTRVTVLAIDLSFFKHIVVHDPVASDWFNSSVIRRWWKAETRLLHMTRGNIETRLDNLRKEYDKPVLDSANRLHNTFDLLAHQDLADLTGTTRQTISKKLKEMSAVVS